MTGLFDPRMRSGMRSNTLDKARGMGATIPAPIAQAEAITRARLAKLDEVTNEARSVDAIVADLLDDKAPLAANPRLASTAVAMSLTQAGRLEAWQSVAGEPLQAAFIEHADAWMQALDRDVYQPAVAKLAEARAVLGDEIKLEDAAGILRRGAEAAGAWSVAQEAIAVVFKVWNLVKEYRANAPGAFGEVSLEYLLTAPTTGTEHNRAAYYVANASASNVWALVVAGVALKLNTAAEAEALQVAIAAGDPNTDTGLREA